MDVCRIVAQYRDAYRITTQSGERNAVLAGRLRHHAVRSTDFPTVGDFVHARLPGDGDAVIESILPRRTVFMRRAAGDRPDDQVIAANIDVVFVIFGLDHDFNVRRVERYLAAVWESGATPVVLLNKADVCDDVDAKLEALRAVAIGVDVLALSALTAEGLEALQPYLKEGVTAGFVGSSGVGKSTHRGCWPGSAGSPTAGACRSPDAPCGHTSTPIGWRRITSC